MTEFTKGQCVKVIHVCDEPLFERPVRLLHSWNE